VGISPGPLFDTVVDVVRARLILLVTIAALLAPCLGPEGSLAQGGVDPAQRIDPVALHPPVVENVGLGARIEIESIS
jgi:hypothetical protein